MQDLIISDDTSMASAIKTVAGFERLVPAPVHAAESGVGLLLARVIVC